MFSRSCLVAIAASIAVPLPCRAQCLEWTPGFGLPGTNHILYSLTVFDDGSGPALVAGGIFTLVGGVAAQYIAAWNGTSWSPLGSGANSAVDELVVFDDGSGPALYAAGHFTEIGGVSANRIAKWDGAAWSPLGSGLDAVVTALAVHDDGSGPALYVGGGFTTAGGVAASRIARWDGSSWSAVGAGMNTYVYALAEFDDGSGPALFAAGGFTTADGASANRIAKWDGSSWSALGSGLDQSAAALVVHDDGSGPALYVGGSFFNAGGSPASRLARWDGSNWSAVGAGPGCGVAALASHDDGTGPALYVGLYDLCSTSIVRRWNGSSWSDVGGPFYLPGGSTAQVLALAVYDDGAGPELFAGGYFAKAEELGVNNLAAWTGSNWRVAGSGSGIGSTISAPDVRDALVFDDGSGPALYVAGTFETAGGAVAKNIARWDGTSWSALAAGLGATLGGFVNELAVFDDGTGPALYAAGYFTIPFVASNIARWKNGVWSGVGTGTNGEVRALAIFDDGSGPALYVGGQFSFAGGHSATCLAKWDGSVWTSIDTGLYPGANFVSALEVFSGGGGPALYVGGGFPGDGALGLRYLARWDGSSWSNVGGGANGDVFALCIHDDGSGPALYAGGNFTLAGSVPASFVARWDGTSWSTVGGGVNGRTYALTAFDAGGGVDLYAGGLFNSAGGQFAPSVARWDGSAWSALGGGAGGEVHALTPYDDGLGAGPSLYVGGLFTQVSPAPGSAFASSRIARWQGCGQPGELVCLGDGTGAPCPCANYGLPGHGCLNSSTIRGAELAAGGLASLALDSLALTSAFEPPNVTSVFLQGDQLVAPVAFGDGLRCAGGNLKRLYVASASAAGVVSAPPSGAASIAARSAELGDPIEVGASRVYQVYYRDPDLAFCPPPAGSSWNVSNGLRIGWLP